MKDTKKKKPFAVNRQQRRQRRRNHQRNECNYSQTMPDTQEIEIKKGKELSTEQTEARQIVQEMVRAFIGTVEWYKTEWGGAEPHDEAVKKALSMDEWRREYVENLEPEKVSWGHISAVGEVCMNDSFKLWTRLRETAADELESGRHSAKVVGVNREPYELAQFLAIRDCFADQWQPNGGIESAMIDMLTIAFSLQMYWSTIAHQRSLQIHNNQQKELNKSESKGWKSPYQYEADSVEQAYRLADGYNRQFLRVLRQLRDLRRYAPVVIQNNGGQINVGAQQINVQQPT
jgi:hypothetical protein